MQRYQLRNALRAVLAILTALALSACGTIGMMGSGPGAEGAPEWVNQGTGLARDGERRLFQGVGQAPGMEDRSLQVETADKRARGKLARTLSGYLEGVGRDHHARAGEGGATEAEASRSMEEVAERSLGEARITERWRDPETDTVHARAELTLDKVIATAARVEDLDPALRDHLRRRGEGLFDRSREDDEE
ncbi:MAG: hypothetical protein ACLFVF_07300 [Thiohalospira sp.]